ncbi:hypothetical protein HDU76_009446, partial [Blyttiomyces sp. JEL0837]
MPPLVLGATGALLGAIIGTIGIRNLISPYFYSRTLFPAFMVKLWNPALLPALEVLAVIVALSIYSPFFCIIVTFRRHIISINYIYRSILPAPPLNAKIYIKAVELKNDPRKNDLESGQPRLSLISTSRRSSANSVKTVTNEVGSAGKQNPTVPTITPPTSTTLNATNTVGGQSATQGIATTTSSTTPPPNPSSSNANPKRQSVGSIAYETAPKHAVPVPQSKRSSVSSISGAPGAPQNPQQQQPHGPSSKRPSSSGPSSSPSSQQQQHHHHQQQQQQQHYKQQQPPQPGSKRPSTNQLYPNPQQQQQQQYPISNSRRQSTASFQSTATHHRKRQPPPKSTPARLRRHRLPYQKSPTKILKSLFRIITPTSTAIIIYIVITKFGNSSTLQGPSQVMGLYASLISIICACAIIPISDRIFKLTLTPLRKQPLPKETISKLCKEQQNLIQVSNSSSSTSTPLPSTKLTEQELYELNTAMLIKINEARRGKGRGDALGPLRVWMRDLGLKSGAEMELKALHDFVRYCGVWGNTSLNKRRSRGLSIGGNGGGGTSNVVINGDGAVSVTIHRGSRGINGGGSVRVHNMYKVTLDKRGSLDIEVWTVEELPLPTAPFLVAGIGSNVKSSA